MDHRMCGLIAFGLLSLAACGAAIGAPATPTIDTIAGRGGSDVPDGDGGPAVDASIVLPQDVALDANGVLYVTDYFGGQVRAVDPDGTIRTLAGDPNGATAIDGMPASQARLSAIRGVAVGPDGSVYFTNPSRVYRVSPDGTLFRVAGTNSGDAFSGDGGPATDAGLSAHDVDVGPDGSLYIADATNHRVRKVSPSGVITTVAGNGEGGHAGDGGLATEAQLEAPTGILVGETGALYISTIGRVRKVSPDGIIRTFAGGGSDAAGTTALGVQMVFPKGLAIDAAGRVYVADGGQQLVRRISADGQVEVVVGSITSGSDGTIGFAGDGGPATEAQLYHPRGIALHGGVLYIADSSNQRVRAVAPLEFPPRGANADFNGDGRSDVLWRNESTGRNVVWLHADHGSQQPVRATNAGWRIAGIGDFEGDGLADILWRHSETGANVAWPEGNYLAAWDVTDVTSLDWAVAATADFDGDGRDDVLWRNTQTGKNVVWHSADYGTQSGLTGVTNLDWQVAGAGDFDGDGRADVLWHNPVTLASAIWRHGDYGSQQAVRKAGPGWTIAGVGDFDGDATDDILWRNTATGANVAWRGGDYRAGLEVVDVTSLDWSVAAVGDYDGDGRDDLLWRNTHTGANVVWRGADYRDQVGLTGVTNPDWQVVYPR